MDYLLTGEESERLHYRKLKPGDFEQWLLFYQDPTRTKYWSEDSLPPIKACEKWFEKVFYRYENHLGGMNALILQETGSFIGQCGLLVQMVDDVQELEIGYSLLPAYRNQGYATEAAKKCKSFAFEHKLAKSLISISM